jgi:hypothetical protein
VITRVRTSKSLSSINVPIPFLRRTT